MHPTTRKKITITSAFVICFLSVLALKAEAQVIVSGTVTDEQQAAIPTATILLLNPQDSSMVKGAVTDDSGRFQFQSVKPGSYILSVSMIGYQTQKTEPFKVENGPVQVEPVILLQSVEQMGEISVSARRPMFEQETDRLVFNVQQHVSSSGNSALELLQKTPGVVVDRQNSSIGMSAKGEVLLMIDDKIQRTPVQVLMARLQGMRAENVERIEVIHQPPAKYDASGAAGIIHIVLKQNDQQGTNGSVALTGGYGQREKAGISLNVNSRMGKLNGYGDYTYNRDRSNRYEINHFREYDYQENSYYYENFVTLRNYREGLQAANLGLDIDFNDRTVVGFLLGGSLSDQVWGSGADSNSFNFVNDEQTGETGYIFGSKTEMSSLTANANLFQQTGTSSHLNFDVDYAGIRYGNSGDLLNNHDSNETIEYDRSTPMEFWITSLDYENQSGSGWTMQAGVKGTFNNTLNNTSVHSLSDEFWTESGLLSSEEKINEQILAGYLSFSAEISDKFNAEAGIRYEHYTYRLDKEEQEDISHLFSNPFPIIRLNYEIDSASTVQLGYNRSITRPAFFYLTSYLFLFDPSLLVYSNPQLRPTFTNNYKISWQRNSFMLSLAYLERTNQIYFYNTVDKENHLQTSVPTNLDNENMIEATLSFPLFPANWWEMNWNLNAFHHGLRDESSRPTVFKKDIFTYVAQLNSTFIFGGGWSIGMDGMYMSRFLDGDQVKYVPPYFNIGLRKEFSSGSSLSITVQDIANSMGKIDWEYHQPALGIKTFGDNDFSERQIRITYTLTFGNQKLSGKRQRETGAEEVKSRM